MKMRIYILSAFILLFAVACNNNDSKNAEIKKSRSEITEIEKELFKKQEADPAIAKDIIDKYANFAKTYPQDSMSPEYLFKAAEVAMNFKEYKRSLSFLSTIESDYPDYNKYGTVIFMKGFIYDNYFNNAVMARDCYSRLISEYPDHAFVQEAKNRIEFLSMSDEELIKVFEQMN